jgi:hypothetical protein
MDFKKTKYKGFACFCEIACLLNLTFYQSFSEVLTVLYM